MGTFSDIRKCLDLLTPRERWRWAGLIPIAVVTALLEALAAAVVFAVVRLLSDPGAIGHLGRWLPGRERTDVVVTVLLLLIALYAVRGVFLAVTVYARHAAVSSSAVGLAGRLLAAYLAAPYVFHLHRDSAHLIRKTTETVDTAVRTFLFSVVALITEILVVAAIVVILATTTPPATLVVVAAVTGMLLLVLRRARPVFARWGAQLQAGQEALLRSLQQSLGGVKEVKATGSEAFFHAAFIERERAVWGIRRREALLSDGLRIAVESAGVIGLLLVVLIVALLRRGGADVMPVLGVYAYAGFRVIPAANRILLFHGMMTFGRAAVRELHDDVAALARMGRPASTPAREIPFRETIALDGVSYGYGDDRGFVLRQIDLAIRRGESIGIVGRSGVGKSTLVELLLGLLEPATGRVTVDGQDIRDGLPSWQARIGYVPHAPFLVEDSLRRNIAFGVPEARIDPRRLETAVSLARLEDLVASLPRGLATAVGERGVRLSAGQRQRVAIARALYREPEVLVLDEATSTLDAQTEREVSEAIDRLGGDRTLIVIAHRLHTVRGCDRIVFLQDGRVRAVGPFDDLMAQDAEFRALAATPA